MAFTSTLLEAAAIPSEELRFFHTFYFYIFLALSFHISDTVMPALCERLLGTFYTSSGSTTILGIRYFCMSAAVILQGEMVTPESVTYTLVAGL